MGWSLRIDSEVAGIAALCAADASGFVAAFCPSLFTMRTFNDDPETASDIWLGLSIGSVLSLIAGFGGSAVTKSWWPLLSTVFVLLVISAFYYWALRNPREGAMSMAAQ